MIHVIATIEVAAGKRDEFLAEFHKLMPAVHAETGCIEYGPTIDAETGFEMQTQNGENVVTILEKWESVTALKDHLTAPHMIEYRERVKDIVIGLALQVLEPA